MMHLDLAGVPAEFAFSATEIEKLDSEIGPMNGVQVNRMIEITKGKTGACEFASQFFSGCRSWVHRFGVDAMFAKQGAGKLRSTPLENDVSRKIERAMQISPHRPPTELFIKALFRVGKKPSLEANGKDFLLPKGINQWKSIPR